MPYRPEREKAGFCKVHTNEGADWFVFARNEYEGLCLAWRAALAGTGERIREVTDLYGDGSELDLLHVVAICDVSPEAIAQSDEEADEKAAYERSHGD